MSNIQTTYIPGISAMHIWSDHGTQCHIMIVVELLRDI